MHKKHKPRYVNEFNNVQSVVDKEIHLKMAEKPTRKEVVKPLMNFISRETKQVRTRKGTLVTNVFLKYRCTNQRVPVLKFGLLKRLDIETLISICVVATPRV